MKNLRKNLFSIVLTLAVVVVSSQEYLGPYTASAVSGPQITNTGTLNYGSGFDNSDPFNPVLIPGPADRVATATAAFSNQVYSNNITTTSQVDFGLMFGVTTSNTQPTKTYFQQQTLSLMSNIGAPSSAYYEPTVSGGTLDPSTLNGFNILATSEGFNMDRLPTNGKYYLGDLTVTFDKPETNPIMHVTGLGGFFGAVSSVPQTQYLLLSNAVVISKDYDLEMLSGTSKTSLINNREITNTYSFSDYALNPGTYGAQGDNAGTGSFIVKGEDIQTVVLEIWYQGKPSIDPSTNEPSLSQTLWSTLNPDQSDGTVANPEFPGQSWSGDQFNISFTFTTTCTLPALSGTPGTTYVGISTLDRNVEGWMSEDIGGYIALESDTKPFVVTRMADPGSSVLSPVEGMVVWDTDDYCLKLYDGTQWKCMTQGCNQ